MGSESCLVGDGVVLDEQVEAAFAAVDGAIAGLGRIDIGGLPAEQQLAVVERVAALGRRVDAVQDGVAGVVEETGGGCVHQHLSAKATLKAHARVSGACAQRRVRAARTLRSMPVLRAAYGRGEVPTESVRAVANTMSNPRLRVFAPVVDEIFTEQAMEHPVEEFERWLADWESIADPDGADQDAERTHERRTASMSHNAIDDSWHLRGDVGALQGVAMAEILARQEQREFEADWAEARERLGDAATKADLGRTPAQRRADALFAIFMRSESVPRGARAPEPVVNVVVDQRTFEDAVARRAGVTPDRRSVTDVDGYRCQSLDGTRLSPDEAVAAALVGHVRRVVLGAESTVIDLGRKRRLFTGASRDAALLQAVLRTRTGLRCAKAGCGSTLGRQVDHRVAWTDGGRTDIANSQVLCGTHNRLKDDELVPVENEPGLWRIHRPE